MMILQQGLTGAASGVDSPEFFWMIYFPIGAWLFGVFLLFCFMLKKYTFGVWSDASPNPYRTETLAMPRGVFRGVLTMTLLFVAVLSVLADIRFDFGAEKSEQVMTAFQMMIAFYFGSKVMHHMTSTDGKKAKARVTTITVPQEIPKKEVADVNNDNFFVKTDNFNADNVDMSASSDTNTNVDFGSADDTGFGNSETNEFDDPESAG